MSLDSEAVDLRHGEPKMKSSKGQPVDVCCSVSERAQIRMTLG
jgi:hypothetical protein